MTDVLLCVGNSMMGDDGAGPLLAEMCREAPRGEFVVEVRKVVAHRFAQLRGDEAAMFASGTLMLESETTPLLPAELEVLGPRRARLTLHEGRYHQVRRMFAAVGNHVDALHRERIGGLTLGDLPEGQWRLLDANDQGRLFA